MARQVKLARSKITVSGEVLDTAEQLANDLGAMRETTRDTASGRRRGAQLASQLRPAGVSPKSFRKRLFDSAILKSDDAALKKLALLCRGDPATREYVLGRLKLLPAKDVARLKVTAIAAPYQGGAPGLGKRK